MAEHELGPEHETLSYREVYDKYYQKVFTYIYNRVRNKEDAEDIAQEVFRKVADVYKARDQRMPHESLSGWLFKIAGHKLIDYYRRREARHSTPLSEELLRTASSSNPEELLASREARDALRKLIKELPKDQQTVLMLRFYEGYSLQQTAQHMGRTEGAIKALQYRAMESLKKKVGK